MVVPESSLKTPVVFILHCLECLLSEPAIMWSEEIQATFGETHSSSRATGEKPT